MSDETWAFEPPPFDALAVRLHLQRALRDLQLAGRGESTYLLQGRPVVEVGAVAPSISDGPAAIPVRIVRRPAVTPEWESRTLRSSSDTRQFLEEVRRRLARWRDED